MPISMSAESRRLRSQKGVAVRRGDPAEVDRVDAEFRAQRLADYIVAFIDPAHPLPAEKLDRLEALLRGAS